MVNKAIKLKRHVKDYLEILTDHMTELVESKKPIKNNKIKYLQSST